ncbi:potassium channel family protein [Rubinisphaera margarita]|uniref:potassium channel family protein n=1 Tax=Rubinisphaera margarita TaxID=2909586 RepID=UPI001EE8B9C3|nr:potassium channel protein [Rubinisphaera margarita]MCG6154666.1 NAD-binding protein [Rubinisphaera margarita]
MTSTLKTSDPLRKIVTGLLLFATVSFVAVLGYIAHGWQVDDAVYMVIITIFGVGYGEVQPIESTGLRGLTIAVIVAGYGAVIYTVGGFMQMLVDGEINKALGARRMTREITSLEDHTIICGFGRMGTILARELQTAGKPFVIIDNCEEHMQTAQDLGYLVLQGDASDEHLLSLAQIEKASVLASVLSDDATNVFVTITAREMNPSITIIARGENPRTERKLLGCGADQVVLPTAIGASRIAQLILRPTAENLLGDIASKRHVSDELREVGLQFEEVPVLPSSPLAGKTLNEIEVRGNHGFLIVGIRNQEGTAMLNPPSETVLNPGDIVVILGHHDDLPQVARKFSRPVETIKYRGAST